MFNSCLCGLFNYFKETVEQYTYLGFTFIPLGKKHKAIKNFKKVSKTWFPMQRLFFKSKKKTLDTYLHLYACESWGDCNKKNKIKVEQLHASLFKQVLGVRETTSNRKVLAKRLRFPFKIYIETQMFKYIQRFPFLEENTYLHKAINEEIQITNSGWMANLKYILDSYRLSNLMINIFKVVKGDIKKM